jgi:hypothetical protein
MSERSSNSRSAWARLRDAEAFLEVAVGSSNAEVKAANALHAGLAAAEAICLAMLGERPAAGSPAAVLEVMLRCDTRHANLLERLLDRKHQVDDEQRRIRAREAAASVRLAMTIVKGAPERLLFYA